MTGISVNIIWCDDGIFCIYCKNHHSPSQFSKLILQDQEVRKTIADVYPEFTLSQENVTANTQQSYLREVDHHEQEILGVVDEYEHFFDWCSYDHKDAFPITAIAFEPK